MEKEFKLLLQEYTLKYNLLMHGKDAYQVLLFKNTMKMMFTYTSYAWKAIIKEWKIARINKYIEAVFKFFAVISIVILNQLLWNFSLNIENFRWLMLPLFCIPILSFSSILSLDLMVDLDISKEINPFFCPSLPYWKSMETVHQN